MEVLTAQARGIKIRLHTTLIRITVQIRMTRDMAVVATQHILTRRLHQGSPHTNHSRIKLQTTVAMAAVVGGLQLIMDPTSTACLAEGRLREGHLRLIRMVHHMGKDKDTGLTDLVTDLVARTQEGVADMADMVSWQVIMDMEDTEDTEGVAVNPKIITHMGTTRLG
jgi:hypothetical protein